MQHSEVMEAIEPFPVEDTFVNGIARIEDVGCGTVRFWLYAVEHLNFPCKVIKAKLVIPVLYAVSMNNQAGTALSGLRKAAMIGLGLTVGV